MNELNIIGIVLALIGFLGLFALGYGLYVLFGWLGTAIFFLIALFITLGGCFICTD